MRKQKHRTKTEYIPLIFAAIALALIFALSTYISSPTGQAIIGLEETEIIYDNQETVLGNEAVEEIKELEYTLDSEGYIINLDNNLELVNCKDFCANLFI
ncbi:hypothetical protein ACFLYT_01925, partial [Nanoarchaeota archaeon]